MRVLVRSLLGLTLAIGISACDGLDLGTGDEGGSDEITTQITTNDLQGVRIRFYRQNPNTSLGQEPWWEYYFTGSQMLACNQRRSRSNPFVANSYRVDGGNTIEVFFGAGQFVGPSERYALQFLAGTKNGPTYMSGRFGLSSFYADGRPINGGTASNEQWQQISTSESWCAG